MTRHAACAPPGSRVLGGRVRVAKAESSFGCWAVGLEPCEEGVGVLALLSLSPSQLDAALLAVTAHRVYSPPPPHSLCSTPRLGGRGRPDLGSLKDLYSARRAGVRSVSVVGADCLGGWIRMQPEPAGVSQSVGCSWVAGFRALGAGLPP